MIDNVQYQNFVRDLVKKNSTLEISLDIGQRLVLATDNSIHQVLPFAVIFPKSAADILSCVQLLATAEYQSIVIAVRGGGSATAGHSLCVGLVLDCTRYMNRILEINIAKQYVRVEPGVILDELNNALKAQGLVFQNRVSSGSRAALGGMLHTDAAGMGSSCFGRMRDLVLHSKSILMNGEFIDTTKKNYPKISAIETLIKNNQSIIDQFDLHLNRNYCGYNLLDVLTEEGLNFNKLLCGSEGTLAITTEMTLRCERISKEKCLLVLVYPDFLSILKEAAVYQSEYLTAAEILDENIVEQIIKSVDPGIEFIQLLKNSCCGGLVFIELSSHDQVLLEKEIDRLTQKIERPYYCAKTLEDIQFLWRLRKKSVEWISQLRDHDRKPIPFIEDTAVPKIYLHDFIKDFKQLLDENRLVYGMYGHLDSACIHVRPALDLTDIKDQFLLDKLTRAVMDLLKKYRGGLCGEHGLGYRSRYNIFHENAEMRNIMSEIKRIFDPYDQLNPGKVAVAQPDQVKLVKMMQDLRANTDRKITLAADQVFAAIDCNGNGACFSQDSLELICPSYKATNDRVHSPKGRAALFRHWLINSKEKSVSQSLHQALEGCLGCKACVSQCPMKVDIPTAKAYFYSKYYQKKHRSFREYLFSHVESFLPFLTKIYTNNRLVEKLFKVQGLPIIPKKKFKYYQEIYHLPVFNRKSINPEMLEKSTPILLMNNLLKLYEPELLLSFFQLIHYFEKDVYFLEAGPSGIALYSQGKIKKFKKIIEAHRQLFLELTEHPLLEIEPSFQSLFAYDYAKIEVAWKNPVISIEAWLRIFLEKFKIPKRRENKKYVLLQHCHETALLQRSFEDWRTVFSFFNLELSLKKLGCCGMAGDYGYRSENMANSQKLYQENWLNFLPDFKKNHQHYVATGFSCRQQIKRFSGVKVRHPLQVLLSVIE